uniref:translation initiation factor IF-2-like n=1 Tax=Callithrix jacchus TaxID=9483 RepID=UPI0023DD6598|nr:translation initiation factor IF-2-like [Callithrix jacchus]
MGATNETEGRRCSKASSRVPGAFEEPVNRLPAAAGSSLSGNNPERGACGDGWASHLASITVAGAFPPSLTSKGRLPVYPRPSCLAASRLCRRKTGAGSALVHVTGKPREPPRHSAFPGNRLSKQVAGRPGLYSQTPGRIPRRGSGLREPLLRNPRVAAASRIFWGAEAQALPEGALGEASADKSPAAAEAPGRAGWAGPEEARRASGWDRPGSPGGETDSQRSRGTQAREPRVPSALRSGEVPPTLQPRGLSIRRPLVPAGAWEPGAGPQAETLNARGARAQTGRGGGAARRAWGLGAGLGASQRRSLPEHWRLRRPRAGGEGRVPKGRLTDRRAELDPVRYPALLPPARPGPGPGPRRHGQAAAIHSQAALQPPAAGGGQGVHPGRGRGRRGGGGRGPPRPQPQEHPAADPVPCPRPRRPRVTRFPGARLSGQRTAKGGPAAQASPAQTATAGASAGAWP